MNNCIFLGRLTKDPESREVGETSVTSFGLAVQRNFKNKEGEYEADFFDFDAWGKQGEAIARFFEKGSLILLTSSARLDRWEKEGEKKSRIKFTVSSFDFVTSKKDRDNAVGQAAPSEGGVEVETDEAIPF